MLFGSDVTLAPFFLCLVCDFVIVYSLQTNRVNFPRLAYIFHI